MPVLSEDEVRQLKRMRHALQNNPTAHIATVVELVEVARDIDLWISHVDENDHTIHLQCLEARVAPEPVLIDAEGRLFCRLSVGGVQRDIFLLEEEAPIRGTPCDQGHYGTTNCGKCGAPLDTSPLPERCPECNVKLGRIILD